MKEGTTRLSSLIVLISFLWTISPAAYALDRAVEIKEPERESISYVVTPDRSHTVRFGQVELEIPAGAVDKTIELTIEKLNHVRDLNQGMKNVTGGASGYRFGPHPYVFKKNIKVSLPYREEIDSSASDLSNLDVWFFNEEMGCWEGLPRMALDREKGTISSLTNHFTDMITSTLTLPESPSPINFDPNSIKELKAADPGSEVPKVKGLEPGSMGGGTFSVPFRLTGGRGKASPQLVLSYNVNSANSWLGKGFDITLPSISTDTRFGLPEYKGKDDYLLNGQALVFENDLGSGVSCYSERIEGAFRRILRYRQNGQDWWEVTEKDGTVSLYGTGDAWTGLSDDQVFTWFLKEQKDSNGNSIRYSYRTIDGYTYPEGITWSGFGSDEGPYRADFILETRPDRRIDNRGKYVSKLSRRLQSLSLSYNGQPYRVYDFSYETNVFGQSQLVSYSENDGSGSEFYSYGFEYFELAERSGGFEGFGSEIVEWATETTLPMEKSRSASIGLDLYLGLSIDFFEFYFWGVKRKPLVSFGLSGGYSHTFNWSDSTMADLDGNGLPDLVWQNGDSLEGLLNRGQGFSGTLSIGDFPGILNKGDQDSFNAGVSASASAVSGGVTIQHSNSYTKSGLSDVNGDGFLDVVTRGLSTFSRYSGGSSFLSENWAAGMEQGPGRVISQKERDDYEKTYYIEEPVKRWEAYKPGIIKITHKISLADDSVRSVDGVRAVVEYPGKSEPEVYSVLSSDPDSDPVVRNLSVDSGDFIYMLLDSGIDIRDSDENSSDPYSDDLYWSTNIEYEAIEIFDGSSSKQAFFYFPDSFSTQPPSILSLFYSKRVKAEEDDPDIWDLSDRADVLLSGLEYQLKKAVILELISQGSFIPRELTFQQFSTVYGDVTPFQKSWLHILYPYEKKKDRFVLKDLDKGYVNEIKSKLKSCFSQMDNLFSYDELLSIALPSFSGEYLYWDGDIQGSPVTGFSRNGTIESVLNGELPGLLDESDLGKSFGMDNAIYLDRILDEASGKLTDFFLIRDELGDFLLKEVDSDGNNRNVVFTMEGSEIAFSRNQVSHVYTLTSDSFPQEIDKQLFEESIIPLVIDGETPVLNLTGELSLGYFQNLIEPFEQNYLIKKEAYETLQEEYDQVLLDLVAAQDALNAALLDEDITGEALDPYYEAVSAITGTRDAMEIPLEESLLAYSEAEAQYSRFTENYLYNDVSGYYELSETVSPEEYIYLNLLMATDINPVDKSLYSRFSDREETDYGVFLLSEDDRSAFLNRTGSYSESDFILLNDEELPDSLEGNYYLIKPEFDLISHSEKIDDLELFRFFYEKFPFYSQENSFYIVNGDLSLEEEIFLETFFEDLNILVPTVLKTEYYYDEDSLFPQQTLTVDRDISLLPVNFADGESILPGFGETCSVFKYLVMENSRSVEKQIATHVFDTLLDYSTAEPQGLFGSYSDSEKDAFFSDDYAYTESNIPADLNAYFSFKMEKEFFKGGMRNWSYGFWSGFYDWDSSLIGQENYTFSEVTENTEIPDGESAETTPPPYLVGATVNINIEDPDDIPVKNEGMDGDHLTRDTWIGSVSRYQDSDLVVKGGEVETVYYNYDFAPYMTGDNIWHPMRKGGPVYYKTPVSSGSGGGAGQSLQDIQSSYSTSGGINFSAANYNQSLSLGVSRGYKSLMDMNGDRFPDLVTNDNDNEISYVAGNGSGFSGSTRLSGAWSFINSFSNNTASFGVSFGGGGSEEIIFGSNGRVRASIAKASPEASFGVGINGSLTASNQIIGLQDINGDGLPDHLKRNGSENYSALMNLGDRFSSASWSNGMESSLNHSNSGSLGGTLSFGFDPVGLSAGLSGTVSYTDFQLMDINGDGLADQVKKEDDTDYFEVRFNYGDTFAPETTKVYCPAWTYTDDDFITGIKKDLNTMARSGIGSMETNSEVSDSVDIDTLVEKNMNREINPFKVNDTLNSSAGVALNLGANVNIRLSYLLFTFTIQPGVNGSIASTGTSVKMMDMTGDGAPEHLLKAPGDTALRLRVNQMDQAGILSGINLPQGGKYILQFDRSRNSVSDPHSRWVLSGLTKRDGYEASPDYPGTHSYTTRFSYSSAMYDREEREFLGFREVTTHYADESRQVNEYLNSRYGSKGKISRSRFISSNDKTLSETVYEYSPLFPGGSDSEFLRLIRETSRRYNEENSYYMETVKEYGYDEFGNICELDSSISGGDEDQDYLLRIDYSRLPGYIVGLPVTLETWTGHFPSDASLIRKREALYDNKGNMTALDQFYSSGDYTRTELDFDEYGNIKQVTDPLGYSMEYEYGDRHQYIERISSFNIHGGPKYNSFMEWDKSLGLDIATIEINGNRQEKEYDSFGRLIELRTPYDSGAIPAVKYSYYINAFPWRALSSNKVSFDPENSETIETVVTIDGLGRVSQTAKEGEVTFPDGSKHRGWNKSGMILYDEKGRAVKEGQSQFEENDYSLPLLPVDFPEPSSLVRETVKKYDELNRVLKVTLSDGSVMTSTYAMGKLDSAGNEIHEAVYQVDPLGNMTEVWKNGRGMISSIVKRDILNRLLTQAFYKYNLLGELQESRDYEGNQVHFNYDLLGRQTSVESPDTGRQEFQYNDGGLLWRKNDRKLRNSGLWIEYEYDSHNRMSRIIYPEMDDVFYTYGTDSDKNSLGRLKSVSNESGTTVYEYGRMGEITSVTRDINRLSPNCSDESAIMTYVSDYLGRMEQITYPDGEVLTYEYDRGGQIVSASGEKSGTLFQYIDDIGYDEYGQRVYIRYGNGTETSYTYDQDRRWLDSIKTGKTDSAVYYQNMIYEFDRAGNILSTENETFNHTTQQEYTYDPLYQIVSAGGRYRLHESGGSTLVTSYYTQDFTYDKIGNMLSKTSSETSSPPVGASPLDYSNLYHYYPDTPHRVEQIGEMFYRYDENGNTIEERLGGHREDVSKEQASYIYKDDVTIADTAFAWKRSDDGNKDDVYNRQFFWDEENRLKGTSDPFHWSQYTYDQDGERTVKYSDLGETLYFNSMWSVADTWASQGLRQSKHIYVGETRIATKLNYKNTSDTGYEKLNTYFYHSDHLGSSSVITDPDGEVYEHLEYTPYGEIWVDDQKDENLDKIPFRFTGKEWDEETRLYYMSARYQNPMTSRWVSADPVGASLTDPMQDGFSIIQSMNWYSYTSNNPIKYTDPTGLSEIEADQINGDEFHDNSGTLRSPEYLDGRLAEEAEKSVGDNYVYGGKPDNDKGGLDCSGFAEKLMEQISGVPVRERNANEQATDPKLTLPGDGGKGSLNFYDWKGDGKIDHVAVELGDRNIINPKGGPDNTTSNPGIIEKRGPFNTPPVNRKVNWRYLILE